MSQEWINSTDMLANAGIINFDAAAYLKNTEPRYTGNPSLPNIYPQMPDNGGAVLTPQLNQDAFQQLHDNNLVKVPSWKKKLFNTILLASGAVLCFRFRGKIYNFLSKHIKSGTEYAQNNRKPFMEAVKNKWNSVTTFCGEQFNKLTDKL